jgi:signal transduction histidine kinase
MRWSIRFQLLTPLLALLLGVVGLSTWTAVASAQRARQQIETQVDDISRTVGHANFPLTERVLELVKGLSGADYVLIDQDGRRRSTFVATAHIPPLELAGESASPLSLGLPVTISETPYLCRVVHLNRSPNVGATLCILYPEALWRDAVWGAVRPSLVFGVCGGMAALALTLGVAQRLGRRFQELERRTRMIAAGDFSPMPLPQRNDELRDLGQSVNEMAQRLRLLQDTVQQTERLRLLGQVGGGLAHQLRNGVTGARLAVQLHAKECGGHDADGAMEVALRQLALVEAHLKRFLDSERADRAPRQRCDLDPILREVISLLRPQSHHAGTQLLWQGGSGFFVTANAEQLLDLFLNIVGNAVDAAGPGGSVGVNVRRTETGRVAVEVTDSGPGPDPALAEKLFDPFITGKAEGIGLGLAVARRISRAHDGDITWERRDGRTCFRVELPAEGGV